MAGLVLVTAPASEPLTTAEAKSHLGVTVSTFDSDIDACVAAARSECETFLKMALLPTVYDWKIDGCFPREIRLPIGPVPSTTGLSITYVDDNGATQTLASSVYRVSVGETAVISLAYGQTWPSTQPVSDAVTVRFTAGYANAAAIPKAILHAVKTYLRHLWGQTEPGKILRKEVVHDVGSLEWAVSEGGADLSQAARNLLMPFVRWS
jgi:uncharacterized phiE125 gp8 family phage protein